MEVLTTSPLEFLRQQTAELHEQINHHPLLVCLWNENPSIAQIGTALAALHGPFTILESVVLDGIGRLGMQYRYHPRRHHMDADMKTLGSEPFPCSIAIDPASIRQTTLLGFLYLLEGTKLGGAVISRRIDGVFHSAFFTPEGDVGESWKIFLTALAEYDDEHSIREISKAAVMGCNAILAHLDIV